MSDMFEIVSPLPTKTTHKQKNRNDKSIYIKLQAEFLTTSFGHYTIKFASMIAEQASSKFPALKSININKSLRQIAKKYFLSDLEMVYVGHIGGLLEWNINSQFILNKSKKMNFKVEGQPVEGQLLMLFLNLIAFFLKKYIGQLQEYTAISDYLHQQTHGQWNSIYEQWLKTCPKIIFKLSPREINQTYSKYAKNCQQSTRSKNYNHLVDQIMELSTTYAMIPGETKENKRTKKDPKLLNIFEQEIEQQKDLIEPYLFGRKIFKPDEVSQLDINKRSDLKKFSELSNEFIDVPQPTKPKIKLGQKGNKQSQINNTVTDFFSKKNNQPIVNKRYAPQSTIGFVDPNPSMGALLFDSKIFSSGSEIIPYPLRSSSNIFRSKLFE